MMKGDKIMSELIYNDSEIYFEYADSVYALEHAFLDSCLECDMIVMESSSQNDPEKIGTAQRLIHSFNAFIKKCIELIETAIDKITGKVSEKIIENKIDSIVNNFSKNLTICKEKGITSFEYYDMEEVRKSIMDEAKAYEKLLKGFSNTYIKRGAKPQSAEKFLVQLEKTEKKFDELLKSALSDIKVYDIKHAEKVAITLQKCKVRGRDGYTDILTVYKTTVKRESDHAIAIIESLDKYSEETGYVQNAKTYQQTIQNTVIYMQRHVAEITTALIKHGIPLLCKIDKLRHTKEVYIGNYEVDGKMLNHYTKADTSSEKRKKIRDDISNIANYVGSVADYSINGKNEIIREDEIDEMKSNGTTLSFI